MRGLFDPVVAEIIKMIASQVKLTQSTKDRTVDVSLRHKVLLSSCRLTSHSASFWWADLATQNIYTTL